MVLHLVLGDEPLFHVAGYHLVHPVEFAVYAALVHDSVAWCALALALGLLSKENAAVAPGLIVWAWLLGIARPDRRRIAIFVATWVLVLAVYVATMVPARNA